MDKPLRERPLMMSDFRGEGGADMTPKNRTLECKNWTLGGMGGQKLSKIVGHHLWMIPKRMKLGNSELLVSKSYSCGRMTLCKYQHNLRQTLGNTRIPFFKTIISGE